MNATHVYHKIKMPNKKSKYSAWFYADAICGIDSHLSILVDCQRIDRLGRCFPCTKAEEETLIRGGWSSTQWHEFETPEQIKSRLS